MALYAADKVQEGWWEAILCRKLFFLLKVAEILALGVSGVLFTDANFSRGFKLLWSSSQTWRELNFPLQLGLDHSCVWKVPAVQRLPAPRWEIGWCWMWEQKQLSKWKCLCILHWRAERPNLQPLFRSPCLQAYGCLWRAPIPSEGARVFEKESRKWVWTVLFSREQWGC